MARFARFWRVRHRAPCNTLTRTAHHYYAAVRLTAHGVPHRFPPTTYLPRAPPHSVPPRDCLRSSRRSCRAARTRARAPALFTHLQHALPADAVPPRTRHRTSACSVVRRAYTYPPHLTPHFYPGLTACLDLRAGRYCHARICTRRHFLLRARYTAVFLPPALPLHTRTAHHHPTPLPHSTPLPTPTCQPHHTTPFTPAYWLDSRTWTGCLPLLLPSPAISLVGGLLSFCLSLLSLSLFWDLLTFTVLCMPSVLQGTSTATCATPSFIWIGTAVGRKEEGAVCCLPTHTACLQRLPTYLPPVASSPLLPLVLSCVVLARMAITRGGTDVTHRSFYQRTPSRRTSAYLRRRNSTACYWYNSSLPHRPLLLCPKLA